MKKQKKISKAWIRRLLHLQNVGWKQLKYDQCYINTEKNLMSRKLYAKQLITLLEQGKQLVQIDETSFNDTSSNKRSWIRKGSTQTMKMRRFLNITAIVAISNQEDLYYSILKGPNTQWTYQTFLEKLCNILSFRDKKMEREDSHPARQNFRFIYF